jgi:predicted secreted protein
MQNRKKLCAISVMAFYVLSMVLLAVPATSAATPTITLTPTSQTPGASVTVTGTGFGATTAVGIGFGAEVQVSNEWMNITGPFDVGNGPYTGFTTRLPIKPTTFRISINISSTTWFQTASDVAGNGTLNNGLPSGNVTLNYVTGNWTRFTTSPVSSSPFYKHICNYTAYEYNVTPVAGVTTSASGSFTANITVPAVASGNYNVTAVDLTGNRAVSSLSAGASSVAWSKTYGGTGSEFGGRVVQTSDGGYAVGAVTNSFGTGGNDVWLIKTDGAGNMQWNKTYGGSLDEAVYFVRQTSDGGYIMSGSTKSFGGGGEDSWLVKTDSAGTLQWNKTFGATGTERGWCVIQTADGGYTVAGWTNSFGAGGADAWLIKTDGSGNMQWNKTYGAPGTDYGLSLVQTIDGGYAFAGSTTSFGAGSADVWLVKTDASGNMQWNKTFGGTGYDEVYALVVTSDGGFAMGGTTWSGAAGNFYLIKTDGAGNMQWNKTYGGTLDDYAGDMCQTSDGYALAGYTISFGAGGRDFWLVETDASGNMQWNMTYGGIGLDGAYAFVQTSDGGYALTGSTSSIGAGGNDVWLIKVDSAGIVPEGLAFAVVMLLSSIAVVVGTRYFRKPTRIAR